MHRKICTLITVMAFVILSAGCAFGDVNLSAIPDANFRNFLSRWDYGWTVYDSNGKSHLIGRNDGILSNGPELDGFPNTFATSTFGGVTTLKGIEFFPGLREIYCRNDGISEIDVTHNPALENLSCEGNKLTELNVRNNRALMVLYCYENNIGELDVRNNTELIELMCDRNPIGQIDVSNCAKLVNLRCNNNDLKELNVRNNNALEVLYCYENNLTELDVSQNPKLWELQPHHNHIRKLDVSHNHELKYLFCGSNDLRELDVTNNLNLIALHCWSNHLTELDLSKNTALTDVALGVQEAGGLKVKAVPEGYEVCLNDYVSNVDNIELSSVGANDYSLKFIKYSNNNGKATVIFTEPPKTLHYRYNTHSPNNDQLYVIIKRSMNVDVIERGAGGVDSLIIFGVADDHYVARGNVPVTEKKIAKYSPKIYGKKGFVADGNSRLIVRVKTERPGNVEFSVKENIGVEIERLSDRAKVSSIHTTDIGAEEYQTSAVLIAPEMYPAGNFPSQDFTVHVKFTADETGEEIPEDEKEMEEDIELEIHAAPVVLIHGLHDTFANCFGFNENTGIWHTLTENRFNVSGWQYNSKKGPDDIFLDGNDLFYNMVLMFFDRYLRKGIVCTKADLVCHSMGGLMARKFLEENGKNLDYDNNWTVLSYKKGMVRRVITVATPHRGSPGADLLIKNEGLKAVLKKVMFDNDDYDSAFRGLMTTAARVYGFPSDVPMYSIHGDVSGHLPSTLALIGAGEVIKAADEHIPVIVRLIPTVSRFVANLALLGAGTGTALGVYLNHGLFHGEGHDIIVSVPSARDDFIGHESGYKGWNYMHLNICHQNDIANQIVSLLKGASGAFKTFGKSKSAMPALNALSEAKESEEVMSVEETLRLHIEPSVFKVSGTESKSVTFTVTADRTMTNNVYCVLGMGNSYKIFAVPNTDSEGKIFKAEVIFTSQDLGIMNAFCFAHNSENTCGSGLHLSNSVRLSSFADTESFNIANLSFLGSEKNIFTSSSSDIPAGLIAQTSDDFAFDVSSPLMGTSWTSSNPSAAYVTDDGMIRSLADGSTTLTATYAGLTASIIVNVGNDFSPPEITTSSLENSSSGKYYSTELQASGTPIISWRIIDGRLPFDLTLSDSGTISGYTTEEGTFTFTAEASNIFGTDSKDFTIIIGSASEAAIMIDANNFPDDNFRAFISNNLDWNHDGFLTEQEINGITVIDVAGKGIKDMKGIEHFIALEYLTCTDNDITKLDLSKNVNLIGFAGHNNHFKTLDFVNNQRLEQLHCGNNQLTSINLGNKPKLVALYCYRNQLSSLNVGECSELRELHFGGNNVNNIDVSNCTKLELLHCWGNPLTILDISKCTKIKDLNCDEGVKVIYSHMAEPEISGTFANGKFKAKYSKSVTVSGDSAPYTWTVISGDVPTGLTLTYSGNKAKLSGTPTKSGTFKFTLTVTDKNNATVTKTFTVKITKPKISGTLSDSTVKASYTGTLKVSGGTTPYTWTKSSGTLPTGLKLTFSGTEATISGTPTTAGTFTFTIKVTDANKATATKSFTVKITKPAISGTLTDGVVKAKYSKALTVSGGAEAYTWTVSSGALPTGLKLTSSGAKATISGTPTTVGSYTFKIKVTDKNKATATKSFTVKITKPAISGTLTDGVVKAKYSKTLEVSGGTEAYTWTVSSGTLPDGLKLTSSGTQATISGTPTKAGSYTFKIKVTDKNKATATKSFTVKITQPEISGTLADGTLKASYSKTLTVSGGVAPYTWSKSSGTLPNGLKLTYSDSKAAISGKPTKAGTFTFKIKVTDANKATATKSFTVNITQPEISGTFANGKLKAKYSKSVTVSGGVKAYTWAVSSGELPTGLKLTYSGTKATISGTPTSSGTFTFTLKVTDANKATATQSFTVKITKPSISGTLPDGTVKTKYTGTLKVSGGTSSYTWVKASGTLPNGLKLTSSNTKATISGTPTKAGTFTFKIKVTDANGATKSKSFTVNIAKASTSDKESTNEKGSSSEKTTEKSQPEKNQPEKNQPEKNQDEDSLPEDSSEVLDGEDTDIDLRAELKVVSEDVVEAYSGKDSDLVKVKAGAPLRFTVSDWGAEVDNVVVYVDDKALSDVTVSDEGGFSLPAEIVHDDFKVGVKAKSTAGKNLESEELYIITE